LVLLSCIIKKLFKVLFVTLRKYRTFARFLETNKLLKYERKFYSIVDFDPVHLDAFVDCGVSARQKDGTFLGKQP